VIRYSWNDECMHCVHATLNSWWFIQCVPSTILRRMLGGQEVDCKREFILRPASRCSLFHLPNQVRL
jgi:hypothetical protein